MMPGFTPRELRKLRASLLALALMLALGIAAVLVSRNELQSARAVLASARSERYEFDGKLRQVRSEEDEIRQKAAVFERLVARGAMGEEKRLEWIELLGEIRERRRLIEMRYEFAPRRALDGDAADAGSPELYASAMSLQARLLHEEDLIVLLADLRQLAPALIQARRCDVSRLPPTNDALRDGLLQADCLIDWITLGQESGISK